MAYIAKQKLAIVGNGQEVFFNKLKALLPKENRSHVVILPTRTQGSFMLVGEYRHV